MIAFHLSEGVQVTSRRFVVQIEQKCGAYDEFNCID
jgi:hypothetical protein